MKSGLLVIPHGFAKAALYPYHCPMNERTPIQTLIQAVGFALWWASGTLSLTWFTDFWQEGIALGAAIGATLYTVAAIYEDVTGREVACWFGLLLIGPVGPMWAVTLLMWLIDSL